MENVLAQHQDPVARMAGAMIAVAVDGYCRESDLLGLYVRDVVDTSDEVILTFGNSTAGDSTKTGRNQGVRLDYPHSHDIIRQYCKGKKNAERVFPTTLPTYTKWWWWAAAFAGVQLPPHSVRHTGASRDLAEGYRTFAQVQRRGRWASEKSVLRYAKTHLWAAAKATTRDDIRVAGQAILATRKPRPMVARE